TSFLFTTQNNNAALIKSARRCRLGVWRPRLFGSTLRIAARFSSHRNLILTLARPRRRRGASSNAPGDLRLGSRLPNERGCVAPRPSMAGVDEVTGELASSRRIQQQNLEPSDAACD
ncbi:hypothetical protein ACQR1Y_12755, partial [Bradyrhizobium sp. HKCCYLRH3099]|uniref:hypothetical protein n=1 Tax=Bradyrhizobium sp. HKCCYLRH3099 TaxID=3420762 RepID=UPI003EBD3ECE